MSSQPLQVCKDWLESRNIGWLSKGSIGRRFASGSFWSFAGTFASRVLGLITAIVVARLLGQRGYGEFGIVISTLGMFSTFGSIGLGITATRYVSRLRHTDPKVAGETAGFTILLAVISYASCSIALYVFSPVLAAKALNAPHLTHALRLISVVLFLDGINGVQIGILSGFESFKVIARVNLWRGIIKLPLTVAATWSFGLLGATGTMSVVALFGISVNYYAIRRVTAEANVPIRYAYNRAQVKLLWEFSLPAFLYGVLSVPVIWIVNAILVNQPNGYLEMGLLNAANQWRNVANFIPTTLSTMGIAIQSNLIGNGETKDFRQAVFYNLLVQVLGTTLIVVLIIVFAPWIMMAYGKSFISGYPVLVLMSIAWLFMSVSSVLWDLMVSYGVVWKGLAFNFISGIVLLLASWQMVNLGAKGIAIAYICYYAVAALLQIVYFMCKRDLEKRQL